MIGPQKILPVNSQPQSSGQGAKANGIVQIQQPNQSGAWILADNGTLYMNGLIVPQSGGLNQIIAQDASCYVLCQNGGDITQQCNNQYFNVANQMQINGNPSSQYFIVYGQSKGENVTQEQYHIQFPDPEIGQPDFNLRMFGYNDFQQWFDNDQFNRPDNSFIQADGNGFRYVCPDNTMVEVDIVYQLRYVFDGTQPSFYFACGLFNVDNNEIVPQSLTWQVSNDIKHKYQTFRTSFTMRTSNSKYFPFFQNQNHDQWSDTEANGLVRSSIKFKFYQFITY